MPLEKHIMITGPRHRPTKTLKFNVKIIEQKYSETFKVLKEFIVSRSCKKC